MGFGEVWWDGEIEGHCWGKPSLPPSLSFPCSLSHALSLFAPSHQSGVWCDSHHCAAAAAAGYRSSLWLPLFLLLPPPPSFSTVPSQCLWIRSVSFNIDCITAIYHLSASSIAGAPETSWAKNRDTEATCSAACLWFLLLLLWRGGGMWDIYLNLNYMFK